MSDTSMGQLAAVYMPSEFTAVVASESGEILVSNDATHTWKLAMLPAQVDAATQRWAAMSGRNAHDEVNAAQSAPSRCAGTWLLVIFSVVASLSP